MNALSPSARIRRAPALSPREALFGAARLPPPRRVPLDFAARENLVSAELMCPYPPGVPEVLPGERLSKAAARRLRAVLRSGGTVAGASDASLAPLKERCRRHLHDAPSTSEIFSCAHALDFVEEGYDGLLHVYAFGCMPQTALKPILQRVAADAGVPLLSLSIGDRFAEEGLENRLEAFIDLLEARKSKGVAR